MNILAAASNINPDAQFAPIAMTVWQIRPANTPGAAANIPILCRLRRRSHSHWIIILPSSKRFAETGLDHVSALARGLVTGTRRLGRGHIKSNLVLSVESMPGCHTCRARKVRTRWVRRAQALQAACTARRATRYTPRFGNHEAGQPGGQSLPPGLRLHP